MYYIIIHINYIILTLIVHYNTASCLILNYEELDLTDKKSVKIFPEREKSELVFLAAKMAGSIVSGNRSYIKNQKLFGD
jgi:hypothetical protein